jgi:hypothetical protein
MRDLVVLFRVPRKKWARYRVLSWLKREWDEYADAKMAGMNLHDDKWMSETAFAPDGDWQRQITQYWGRANALGLDTYAGRQAMMKSITTLIDGAAAMIRVYGDPPLPGYPSGEIHMSRRGGEDGNKEQVAR